MKHIASILFLALIIVSAFGQSKVTPASRSELSGIELPTGAKQDKRILATASAKTLLDMIAEDNQIELEEGVEVFTLIGAIGSGTVDQVKLAAQKAGWILTLLSGQTKYWLLTKNKTTLLMYLESNKRDTQLYFCSVNSIGVEPETPAPPAVSQNTSVNQNNNQTNNSVAVIAPQKETVEKKVVTVPTPAQPSGYSFTTINFDDGWVSTVREDWVEVTKNNVKVLIHYPNATTSKYISDSNEELQIAWNTLVAPRYSNLQNYFVAKNSVSYFQSSFVSGTLTDKQTGQTVYVALFKRDHGAWLEFIAPTINTFGQVIGFDINKLNDYVSSSDWDPLLKLEYYNRFAVAASDLTGIWTNNFGGYTQYVNAYTGANAGMNTHSSTQTFEFLSDGTYNWSIGVASGFVGNIKFSSAKSSGKFTNPNNWQIHFSELEGKPRLYNAYFSCVKGARILWLQDTGYGDYSSYGRKE